MVQIFVFLDKFFLKKGMFSKKIALEVQTFPIMLSQHLNLF